MNIRQSNQSTGSLRVDLHIHSTHSDGKLSLKEIVAFAKQSGLGAISITDHDTISGLAEAETECRHYRIELINGVELSVRQKTTDLHLLGYLFDSQNESIIEYAEFFRNERVKRAREIVLRLNDIGIPISFEMVQNVAGNGVLGRPHIACALLQSGYVKSFEEAFQYYLSEGCICFVPKFKISPAEAISMIHRAGGVCCLAHPGNEIADETIFQLIRLGLDGIETLHPRHSQAQVDHFREIVHAKNLVETGGTDCHGKNPDDLLIGRLAVPYGFVERMKNRQQQLCQITMAANERK